MMKNQQGFIRWIILIIIAVIVLGYYGFDIKKAIEAPTTQNNLTYVQQVASNIWHGYLERPVTYLWNEIFLKLIWAAAIDNLNRVKNNQPTTIDEMAPKIATPGPVH
jgi:hypothetical protein